MLGAQILSNPILVTRTEYFSVAFVFVLIGLFYTMHQMFLAPHERERDGF